MHIRTATVVLAALVACVAGRAAMAAPVIVNPGFETSAPSGYGAIPSWTQVPNPSGLNGFTFLSGANTSGQSFFNNGTTLDPTHVAFIQVFGNDPNGASASRVPTLTLQQQLSGFDTTKQYRISYLENARAGQASPFLRLDLDAVTIVAQHVSAPVQAAGAFTQPFRTVTSVIFTPTSATPLLKFVVTQQANGNDASALIDNVVVTEVPEPASSAALALAGVVLTTRRTRRAARGL